MKTSYHKTDSHFPSADETMTWQSHLMPMINTHDDCSTAGLLAVPLNCPTIYEILAKHRKSHYLFQQNHSLFTHSNQTECVAST